MSSFRKILLPAFAALLIQSLPLQSQVVINEYSASNLSTIQDNYQEYEDWIELYNTGSSIINIGGYYLSDDTASPLMWAIPAGVVISPHGHLKIWASGRDEAGSGHYHANFRLTQTKPAPTGSSSPIRQGRSWNRYSLKSRRVIIPGAARLVAGNNGGFSTIRPPVLPMNLQRPIPRMRKSPWSAIQADFIQAR
jgi:hypothetical protein